VLHQLAGQLVRTLAISISLAPISPRRRNSGADMMMPKWSCRNGSTEMSWHRYVTYHPEDASHKYNLMPHWSFSDFGTFTMTIRN